VSVLDLLKPHAAFNAEYNSQERKDQQASICEPGTRKRVIDRIVQWAEDDHAKPICWLYGPAGTGKSSIAHTIAEECTNKQWLVLTFFFSRGRVDRTTLTKVFTTLAYQLAVSEALPSAQQFIEQAIQKDRRILSANFETQFCQLVVYPIMASPQSMPKIIIIIDGLDECESHAHQTQLIKLLVERSPAIFSHARFLVTSRPEEHINDEFYVAAAQNITNYVTLHDFDAVDDIRKVCCSGFADIATRHSRQQYLPKSWPSDAEIELVVEKSQGIFIYISTLLRFVDEGDDLPQKKLQYALKAHAGLDSIYCQVLALAPGRNLQVVMSAIILLQEPLTIMELGEFLHLTSAEVRIALQGTRSILNIPESDDKAVVPYHASLGDFVRDNSRSAGHISTLNEQHRILMDQCIHLAITGMEYLESDRIHSVAMLYAYRNWCYHLASLLASPDGLANIPSQIQLLKSFLSKIKQQWLRHWLYSLDGMHKGEYYAKVTGAYLQMAYEQLQVQTLL
jgi:NACHT domain